MTMAEKGDEENDLNPEPESGLSSWWGSFYDTAKQKLAETNEFLVRDIKEFTDTVKTDTSKLVANTAASMKDQLNIKVNLDEASNATKVVTNSISGFLGKVVHHVTPIPPADDEDADSTMFLGTSSGVKVMSPAEARLFSLQTSPSTYCNEPDNAAEFDLWLESFNLDQNKEELSLLMLDFKEIRSLYTKLVPEVVSHVDFWTRYFYKKHQLEKAEERRAKLVERAETTDPELGWGEEDEFDVDKSEETKDVHPEVEGSTHLDDVESNSQPNPASTEEESDIKVTIEEPAEVSNSHIPEPVGDAISPAVVDGGADPTLADGRHVTEDSSSKLSRASSSPSPELVNVEPNSNDNLIPASNTSPEPEANEKSAESSTPKKGAAPSSGDSSDWEKEFDLEMTEDEISQALLEESNDVELEDWEAWE